MIDQEYNCDWFIEKWDTTVKTFPVTELKKVRMMPIVKIGPFHWVKGLVNLLKSDYDIYFMLGETRNVSLFIFCIIQKMFYSNKRVYFWSHGFYGKESKLELMIWKRPLFHFPNGIFTYGDYAKKIMVEDGFDENKIFPIHNSLDYDTQVSIRKNIKQSSVFYDRFKNNNPVIIFIGRLTKVKKLNFLLEAVTILKNKEIECNVVFVGDGSEREKLENITEKNGLSNMVWFYGACYDEKENAELLYNADLCVAPGNIGLTAIHALMFGCPAVSHDNFFHQMPEFEAIKPNETGEFYKYGSVNSLADTINRWFSNHKDDRDNVRNACFKEIDTYWNPYYQMAVIRQNLV